MTIAHRIKKLALNFGIELNRYNPAQSQEARMARCSSQSPDNRGLR